MLYTLLENQNLSDNYIIKNKNRRDRNKRQKYNPNSLINPNLNQKVIMWFFVRSTSKTFIVTHNWTKQVEDFPFNIYNQVGRRWATQRGSNGMFHGKIILIGLTDQTILGRRREVKRWKEKGLGSYPLWLRIRWT